MSVLLVGPCTLYVHGQKVGTVSKFELKDSGQREEFSTGSRRDTREGKGRFDLISPRFLRRLAAVLEKGAIKYGERNWEAGQPLSRYLDSALRHINGVLLGLKDEDHATQAGWNLHSFIHTAELIEEGKLPASLDDIGYAAAGAVEVEEKEFTEEYDTRPTEGSDQKCPGPAGLSATSSPVSETHGQRLRGIAVLLQTYMLEREGYIPICHAFELARCYGEKEIDYSRAAHEVLHVEYAQEFPGGPICWRLPDGAPLVEEVEVK